MRAPRRAYSPDRLIRQDTVPFTSPSTRVRRLATSALTPVVMVVQALIPASKAPLTRISVDTLTPADILKRPYEAGTVELETGEMLVFMRHCREAGSQVTPWH